ncbi:MAG: hypothetical protein IT322_18465 [Anaerolineae bacterium]|nr:hypothetical protein [Anaerolineae bacterium]
MKPERSILPLSVLGLFLILLMISAGSTKPTAVQAQGSTPGRTFGDVVKTSEHTRLEGTLIVPPNPESPPIKGGSKLNPPPATPVLRSSLGLDWFMELFRSFLKWLFHLP